MSYAVPGPKPRPGVVTAAAAVLFFLIPVRVVASTAGVVVIAAAEPGLARNIGGVDAETARRTVEIGAVIGIVIALVLIAGYAALAAFVARGSQVARILTWVFGGIGILVELVALRPGDFTSTSSYVDVAGDTIPGWIRPTGAATTALTLMGLILAVVLLAMPTAHDFFRKPPAQLPLADGPYPYYPPATGYQPHPLVPPLPPAAVSSPHQPLGPQLRPAAPAPDSQQPD